MRALRFAALAGWALLTIAVPLMVSAAGPVVPDSSCATESTFKSLKGDAKAVLQVFNKSSLAVKVFWLDYNGKRVLYESLPPFTSYNQETWLTHPWVIATADGQCLRFLVMTSQLQAVTVQGEPPDPDTTALPLSARQSATPPPAPSTPKATTAAGTAAPAASGSVATPTPSAVPAATGGGSSNTGLVAAAAVAVVVAGVGFAAATGRMPGMRRGRR